MASPADPGERDETGFSGPLLAEIDPGVVRSGPRPDGAADTGKRDQTGARGAGSFVRVHRVKGPGCDQLRKVISLSKEPCYNLLRSYLTCTAVLYNVHKEVN